MEKSNIITLKGAVVVSYMYLTMPPTDFYSDELPMPYFEFEFVVSGIRNIMNIPCTPGFSLDGDEYFLGETFSEVEISETGIKFTK
jgi:hypothetical protein